MANSTAAELLIRIGADPSNAEASISRFRASFSRDLGGLGSDLGRWTSQGTTQLNLAGRSAGSFGRQFSQAFTFADGVFRQNRESAAWRRDLLEHFAAVGQTSQALESSLFRSFADFDFALSRNVATALIWEKSIGQAFQRAAVTAIGALAQEAIVRAIFSTALGFYLLAIRDFTGAARAFESAAIFGTVGGAAALAGRALASGANDGSSLSASGREQGASRSSRADRTSASGSPASQPSIQIIFQGPVYGGQAGIDQLTKEISRAVIERDVNLTAFTTVRQPATRA